MPTLPVWVWKLLAGLLLIAATAGVTWFAADAHYSKQYVALKASYDQATKDQQAANDRLKSQFASDTKELENEYKAQLADLGSSISDLGMRLQGHGEALRICTNDPVWTSVPVANGSGTGSGPTAPAAATGSTEPTIAIPAGQLRDDLKIGIDAIAGEKALRRLLQEGGQTP